MTKYVFDTNTLILRSDLLELEGVKIIPFIVLVELDRLKMGFNETAYRAREAIRKLKSSAVTYDFEFDNKHSILENGNNDDVIIACAKKHDAILITGDFNVQLKARAYGIECFDLDNNDDEYCGYIEVEMSDVELANFYEDLTVNHYNALVNQYLIIKRKNEIVDTYKWNGNKFVQVTNKNITTMHFGKFKPLDVYQKCAIDSLFSNDVTLLRGKAGSGKSLIALNYAMSLIESTKYQKLVCVVNPAPVKNAQPIGFYKGDKDDKLLQSGIGNILISKFGDKPTVEAMIGTGKIVLIPMVDLRGYDSGDNSVLWITEGQNASGELMKLALQRVADGSKIIVDGDDKTQVDSDAFAGFNNGIKRMSRIFRGTDVYGEMTFDTIYRSKIAAIADKM